MTRPDFLFCLQKSGHFLKYYLMRLINFLLLTVLIYAGCKSDNKRLTDKDNEVKVEFQSVEDSLLQITDRGMTFSNGTSEFLPFADDPEATIVVMVRHAEKDSIGDDPDLTVAGQARAERLADIIKDFPLNLIYTNAFERTVKTAQPSAYQHQQAIQFYDHEAAAGFISTIAKNGQGLHLLVVGRANTVPEMLNTLAEEKRFPDIDESDYSNIYIIGISESGQRVNIIRAIY